MKRILIALVLFFSAASQATTYLHVTAAGAGDNSGDSWANAMASSDFVTHYTGTGTTDYWYYLKDGTYDLSGGDATAFGNGTQTVPGVIIGVKSGTTNEDANVVTTDWATGDNRPLISLGTSSFITGDWWCLSNLRFTGTDATRNVYLGASNRLFNCYSSNTNNGRAFSTGSAGNEYVACEGTTSEGIAFDITSSDYVTYITCYAHDSDLGFEMDLYSSCINCVADTCTTGIDVGDHYGWNITNCTVWGCTTGISGSDASGIIFGTIISGNTDGAVWSSQSTTTMHLYNLWYNTTDITNLNSIASCDYGAVTLDPGLNDPNNGDFSITSTDNAADKANAANDLTGATL